MKESKFLGALFPSHPDLIPIIETIRDKYKLPVVNPQEDPIKEIYLGDEFVSFEEFRQEIKNRILENLNSIFPENYVKQYQFSKKTIGADFKDELAKFPEEIKPVMEGFFEYIKNSAQTIFPILDAQIDSVANMLYVHLLLGETQEAPEEWFGKVMTMDTGGETILMAMASEVTNLDLLFHQFRELHKKTFGVRPKKVTKTAVETAYYLQLTKIKKDKDFILDEYIRLNKLSLPRNTNSARYLQVKNMHAQRLKKRLQRTKAILDVIVRDKK